MHPQIETWQINNRINEFLLNGIKEEHLTDHTGSKGRSVDEQFAHLHNVRLMWIKVAEPGLLSNLNKIEKGPTINKALLIEELAKSSEAISQVLETGFNTGKIKGFKPHPEAFLGYMIAHEAHHRAQAILILKENGHLPDKKILYGMWEWGSR